MSKPIEDPPSLVDILAREHAARRALIEAECSHALAIAATSSHAIPVASDTEVDARTASDTQVDIAIVAPLAHGSINAAPHAIEVPPHASSPRLLVEELTRKCCERRAALDKEANRG